MTEEPQQPRKRSRREQRQTRKAEARERARENAEYAKQVLDEWRSTCGTKLATKRDNAERQVAEGPRLSPRAPEPAPKRRRGPRQPGEQTPFAQKGNKTGTVYGGLPERQRRRF